MTTTSFGESEPSFARTLFSDAQASIKVPSTVKCSSLVKSLAFVDHLLKWANGLQGKFDKLLIPVTRHDEWQPTFKQLRTRAADINTERNSIAHSGQFKKKSTATRVVKEARDIILTLVAPYYDGYDLPTINLD